MQEATSNRLENLFVDYQSFLLEGDTLSFDFGLFKKEVWGFFEKCDQVTIEALFEKFCKIWSIFYREKEFLKASQFWDLPISLALKWEEQSGGKFLHKGTPYYCKAMSLLKIGNIDTAFLFFHQAVEEDRKWPSNANRQTPAWLFVTLNENNPKQAALETVKGACKWLEFYLNRYSSERDGNLSLEGFRANVLAPSRFDETTFSFTHSIFRIQDVLSVPDDIRSSQFAAQIELDMLFNLARIAEVWLNDNDTVIGIAKAQLNDKHKDKPLTFFPLLKAFFHVLGSPCLSEPEHSVLKERDFDELLVALLDGNHQTLKRVYLPYESDLLILYVLRNKAGHAPSSSFVIQNRFPDLVERALFGLFNVAEKTIRMNAP